MAAGSVLSTHEYPLGSAALSRHSSRAPHPPLLTSQGFDTVVAIDVHEEWRKGRPTFTENVQCIIIRYQLTLSLPLFTDYINAINWFAGVIKIIIKMIQIMKLCSIYIARLNSIIICKEKITSKNHHAVSTIKRVRWYIYLWSRFHLRPQYFAETPITPVEGLAVIVYGQCLGLPDACTLIVDSLNVLSIHRSPLYPCSISPVSPV